MRLVMLSYLLFLVACSGTGAAEDSACRTEGSTSLWAMSFCMSLHETDDELHPGVSTCHLAELTAREQPRRDIDCEANLAYKTAICSLAVNYGSFEGSLLKCIDSEDMTPAIVRRGAI